ITITMAQALRAGEDIGVHVPRTTIERAIDYVKRSQKPDGSFRYSLSDESATIALTAAAIATLQAAGHYAGPEIDEGYAWLFPPLAARDAGGTPRENRIADPAQKRDPRRIYCFLYERLYLAQALWQHPEARVFADWAQDETQRVVTSQREDGSWADPA